MSLNSNATIIREVVVVPLDLNINLTNEKIEELSPETEPKKDETPVISSNSSEKLIKFEYPELFEDNLNNKTINSTEKIDSIHKDEVESSEQMGLVFYTFSDKVTPGLINYSVITFYVSIVFVAGKLVRSFLWGNTPKILIKDVPYPDELLTICEGVVISRMRKDILKEEELYMLLKDLIRSPEILKEITHHWLSIKKN